MKIETAVNNDLLKHEMEILSQKINHFDNLRRRAKQMALTLSVAIIGVGFKFGDFCIPLQKVHFRDALSGMTMSSAL